MVFVAMAVVICGINVWLWKKVNKLKTELLREQSKVWIYECAYPEKRKGTHDNHGHDT